MVTPAGYVPERGDVVWILLTPPVGAERVGRQLAVVVSPASYNGMSGLALLCPIVSQAKGYPFEVPVPEGLPARGVILADQVKCLDWRVRATERACVLSQGTLAEVLRKTSALVTL